MALHDFWCTRCGVVLVDVNVSIQIGAQKGAPLHCGEPTAWLPKVGRMDAYEPFQEFVTRDGRNELVLIDSLKKLRDVERQSEQDYRNEEGQPVVWRRYSNDSSNRDVHTLHPNWNHGERPDPAWVRKNAAGLKKSIEDPDCAYGPGVTADTPTGLDHLK